MTAGNGIFASALGVLVPLKSNLLAGTDEYRTSNAYAQLGKTYVRTSRDGERLDACTGETVDVAGQISGGNVGDWVVVRRDTDIIVLSFVDLPRGFVGSSALTEHYRCKAVPTPLSQIYCMVTREAKSLPSVRAPLFSNYE